MDVFSVQVSGILNSEQPFKGEFMVPACSEQGALEQMHAELDWSDAKRLHMTATLAHVEDIPEAAHHSIVRIH